MNLTWKELCGELVRQVQNYKILLLALIALTSIVILVFYIYERLFFGEVVSPPSIPNKYICGNGICELNEDSFNCCKDCECPDGQVCRDDVCCFESCPSTFYSPWINVSCYENQIVQERYVTEFIGCKCIPSNSTETKYLSCGLNEICENGACVIRHEEKCPTSCDDNNPCTFDWCNISSGYSCSHEILNGDIEGCYQVMNPCRYSTCSYGKCITINLTGNQVGCSGYAGKCKNYTCNNGECVTIDLSGDQPECSGSAGICKNYTCIDGICAIINKTNCCGNGVCEGNNNENCNDCPEDCSCPYGYECVQYVYNGFYYYCANCSNGYLGIPFTFFQNNKCMVQNLVSSPCSWQIKANSCSENISILSGRGTYDSYNWSIPFNVQSKYVLCMSDKEVEIDNMSVDGCKYSDLSLCPSMIHGDLDMVWVLSDTCNFSLFVYAPNNFNGVAVILVPGGLFGNFLIGLPRYHEDYVNFINNLTSEGYLVFEPYGHSYEESFSGWYDFLDYIIKTLYYDCSVKNIRLVGHSAGSVILANYIELRSNVLASDILLFNGPILFPYTTKDMGCSFLYCNQINSNTTFVFSANDFIMSYVDSGRLCSDTVIYNQSSAIEYCRKQNNPKVKIMMINSSYYGHSPFEGINNELIALPIFHKTFEER